MYSVFSHKGYKARKKGDYMKKNAKQWLRKAASVGLAFSLGTGQCACRDHSGQGSAGGTR